MKKKGQIYDPDLPAPPLPFRNAPEDAKCDKCGNKAILDVNLPEIFKGYLCDKCRMKVLPYPYNEKRE